MIPRAPAFLLAASVLTASALPAQDGHVVERDTAVVTGKIRLPATLAIPSDASHAPGIVLVHGSGPNDRDETVGANKPFRDLAHGLAERGIVVLRYDKRSKVAPLSFMGRPFTVDDEVVDDALSAAALLRGLPEVDPARVVVLGHSLGGMLAPRIGERDTALAGLVILAGATRPLTDMLEEQIAYMRGLPGADTGGHRQGARWLGAEPGGGPCPDPRRLRLAEAHPRRAGGVLARLGRVPSGLPRRQASPADPHPAGRPGLPGDDGRFRGVAGRAGGEYVGGVSGVPESSITSSSRAPVQPNPAEYEVAGTVDPQVISDIAEWVWGLPPE